MSIVAKLIYAAIGSLDGYLEDETGSFDWAMPAYDVHAFINGLHRTIGTYLYGRRMYETMAVWETDPGLAAQSDLMADFAALWQAAEKVVFSTTLQSVATARTRLERAFDADTVRRIKESVDRDVTVGGPDLAAHAFEAGLVDECHLFLVPVAVGGGKPALPVDGRLDLELLDHDRFTDGTIHLHYRPMP